MSKTYWGVLLTGIIVAAIFFVVWQFIPFIGDPCTGVPITNHLNVPNNPTIRIVSPNSGRITAIYWLPIETEIQNFQLEVGGNTIHVWVDGRLIDAESIRGTMLIYPTSLTNAGVDTADGLRDICIALVDGNTGAEIGNRSGVRLILGWRGPDQIDLVGWAMPFCLLSASEILGILIVLALRRFLKVAPRA
jgi:hypothetical protein